MKRLIALQPLSREHYTALNFCSQLNKGLKNKVQPERMQLYIKWFWDNHLMLHFKVEEQDLFTLLPATDSDIKRALDEHKSIKDLCHLDEMTNLNIKDLAEQVKAHVRFEERVLFNKIQDIVETEKLNEALKMHAEFENTCGLYQDVFWE